MGRVQPRWPRVARLRRDSTVALPGAAELLSGTHASTGFVVAVVGLATGAGWLIVVAFGHASSLAFYWLCAPVVIAAGRFGRRGAAVAAVCAGLAAGPLAMAVSSNTQMSLAVWVGHTVFLILIGQLVAGLLKRIHAADLTVVSTIHEQREEALAAFAERDALSHRLAHQASHDSLTGLANRSLFLQLLQDTLARSAVHELVGVLFIDLNDFKIVNDTFGHAAGDELLIGVSERLRHALREHDLVARFGGDEFAVLLRHGSAEQATAVANRLLGVLRAPFALSTGMASGQASGGLVLAARDLRIGADEQGADLLRRADLAMYAAKSAGHGRCVEFRDELDEAMLERLSIQDDITQALIREDFVVHYQPIVEVRTRKLVSVEALLRWDHPQRGNVPPDQFIHIAEKSGAIVELGMWVLSQACADLQRWDESCPGSALQVAVNVSARQLKESSVGPQIARVLHGGGIDPRRLILEVTESLLMDDKEAAAATLWQLRALGIRIAVDDFGTGYSSLSRLVDLPLDDIKIDRSFVAELERSDAGATIVTAAVAMAHGLGLNVVAEGVENLMQLRFLEEAGCDHVQGFLISRPVSADGIERMLRQGPAADFADSIPAARVSPEDSLRSARPSPAIIPLMQRHR